MLAKTDKKDIVKKFGNTYKENQVLFREGDFGDSVYLIHQGKVKIAKKAKDAEQVLAVLKAGDFFGEMSLFNDLPRSATAVTLEDSIILQMNRNNLDITLNKDSDFTFKMIQTLCERLFQTDQKIEELLNLSKEARILKAIIGFWQHQGRKDTTGEHLIIPYEKFLYYVSHNLGIENPDTKKAMLNLKKQNMLHIRKDTNNRLFIVVSPKSLQFMEFS